MPERERTEQSTSHKEARKAKFVTPGTPARSTCPDHNAHSTNDPMWFTEGLTGMAESERRQPIFDMPTQACDNYHLTFVGNRLFTVGPEGIRPPATDHDLGF
jgi:hypothetical protein